jgi:hypothetical protein
MDFDGARRMFWWVNVGFAGNRTHQ